MYKPHHRTAKGVSGRAYPRSRPRDGNSGTDLFRAGLANAFDDQERSCRNDLAYHRRARQPDGSPGAGFGGGWLSCFFNLAAVNRAARHFAALSANLTAIESC